MHLSVRSDLFDREVRLAIENGNQKVDTFSGSGYLLPSSKSIPRTNIW
jgi:hypothetical protein